MADRIHDMRLFRLVVQTGSLSTAGRQLGLSPAAMSGRLKGMEGHYGVPLLKRRTRDLSMTPEGHHLFENAVNSLAELESLNRTIRAGPPGLEGQIAVPHTCSLCRQTEPYV